MASPFIFIFSQTLASYYLLTLAGWLAACCLLMSDGVWLEVVALESETGGWLVSRLVLVRCAHHS